MSRPTFPYGVRIREDSRIEVFPAADLLVKGRGERKIRLFLHIDSGATTSVLPAVDAEELGINVFEGKKALVRGIFTEEVIGYRHLIGIEFNGTTVRVPVIFVEALVPRILGREGIFPHFGILFYESKRKTIFLDVSAERKMLDSLTDG